MRVRPTVRTGLAGTAAAVAGSLLLAGCGSDAPAAEQKLHDRLPASVKSSGVLRIGAELNYPPVDFKDDSGKPAGLDPDLAEAIGKELGVKVQFVDTAFDKLLPGLSTNEFDLVMSGMSDNRQRREGTDEAGKQIHPGVDFVDYFIAGTSIVVPKGNPKGVNSLDDLCGQTVALQRGTTQATVIQRQTAACEKVKKPLGIKLTDSDADALTLVAGGKAAADLSDFPVAAGVAQKGFGGAQFQLAGQPLQSGPFGMAVAKSNEQLRDTLAKALDQVIRSGEYEKILTKWGVTAGAAQNAVVNGGF
ncbi:ABC transporter substrate-binding protein [Kitasatospora camelliae]|uniref:ABC transporter substrate-binding protein n=1 Tax=Kitasatospora camelliae TaxID=3156397 RepID=A0AAU8JZW7_9ACTN